MFRYDKDRRKFVDGFAKYMVGRKVTQTIGHSNDAVDKECGCCFGAHLARYFATDGVELHDLFVDDPDESWRNDSSPSDWIGAVPSWRDEYYEFAVHHCRDHDLEDDDLMEDDNLIEAWMESRNTDYDFSAYNYEDGARLLYEYMDCDRPQYENALNTILSVFAHDGRVLDPFSGCSWDDQNLANVLRNTMIAWEYVHEKCHETFSSLDQHAYNVEGMAYELNEHMPAIRQRIAEYSERI